MPSKVDQRRLRDGARGLALSTDLKSLSVEELQALYNELYDAACAMQSLDDLGSPEANDRAWKEMQELDRRRCLVGNELEARRTTTTPKAIGAVNDKQRTALEVFARFCGLESITYKDRPGKMGEDYILVRPDGSTFTLRIRGNRDQGGFAAFAQEDDGG